MITMATDNNDKILNFSSKREQRQACLNDAEQEKNQGLKIPNVPTLRFPEFSGDWTWNSIGSIATIVGGGTPDTNVRKYWNGDILWFTPSEIGKTKYVADSLRTISVEGLNNSSAKILPINTILLSTRATVGECSINTKECSTNQGFQSLVANKKVLPEYLYYLVQTKRKDLMRNACGSTFLEISANEVRKIKVAYPSIIEQEKVINLLHSLDDRIATQNKIIEDLKLQRDAIAARLLSPKEDWKEHRVSDIAEIGRGRVISAKEIASQNNPQYPVYSSQTSNNGIMGYLDNYAFEGEYITWTTDGANAGTVFYRNGYFNCTNVCGTLKIHQNVDTYFCSLILSNATKKYVSVNLANPKLMNNTMASIKIQLPSYNVQRKISRLFRLLDEKIFLEQHSLASYQKQKKHLLQQMFI